MDSDVLDEMRSIVERLHEQFGIRRPEDISADRRSFASSATKAVGLHDLRPLCEPVEASVQECAILVEDFGGALICAPLIGPLIANEALRLMSPSTTETSHRDRPVTLALGGDLSLSMIDLESDLIAWDADEAELALAVGPDGQVCAIAIGEEVSGPDMVRVLRKCAPYSHGSVLGTLEGDALASWQAFALVMISSEIVGVAARFLWAAVDYSMERVQYGRPIGTFQAVQHILARGLTGVEASLSATRFSAWAADNERPVDALQAARVAKAYASITGREVVYAGMQVFGGIAMTWEHEAHLALRRVLLDGRVFSTVEQLVPSFASEYG